MADNVELDAGSGGAEIATDDIGGIQYPRSKIVLGADGTNDGDVSQTNPLPVKGTGTAGSAHAGVVTVQGVASMTPVQIGDNSGSITVDAPVATPVFVRLSDGSSAVAPATSAKQDAEAVLVGAVDETAPATDTASSGLNGRLQRIAQRISSLISLLPTALSNGFFQVSVKETIAVPVTDNGGNLSIDDGGNSITVDAPVGTPAFVRLSDGSSAISTLPVSLASVPSHAVTNAGTFPVQVDGNALTALQLIDDPVFTDDAAFTPATSKVMMAGFECDETATDSVDEGDAGAARMTADRKQIVTIQPHTAGGLSMSSVIGAANTNATVVKNSAGQVYEIVVTNINAAVVYLKLYNKATTPDENDTPVWRMAVPGNAAGAGIAKTFPNGLLFSTGIAYRVVGGVADNSTTAVSANEQLVNVGYK